MLESARDKNISAFSLSFGARTVLAAELGNGEWVGEKNNFVGADGNPPEHMGNARTAGGWPSAPTGIGAPHALSPTIYVCADELAAKRACEQFLCLTSQSPPMGAGRTPCDPYGESDGRVAGDGDPYGESESKSSAIPNSSLLIPNCILLPAKDDVLNYRRLSSSENHAARLSAMAAAVQNPTCIVVTTVEAVCQLFPLREQFEAHFITIEAGKDYDPQKLAKRLVQSGYRRESLAAARGQFSLRGDILDVFPLDRETGVRVEFFGDTVESIKAFDAFDLTSKEALERIFIPPNTEVFYSESEVDEILTRALAELDTREKVSGHKAQGTDKGDFAHPVPAPCALCPDTFTENFEPRPPSSEPRDADAYHTLRSHLTSDLTSGSHDMRLSFLMPLFNHCGFADFFKPARVIFDDAKQVADQLNLIYTEHENRYKAGLSKGEVLKSSIRQLAPKESALAFACPKLAFHAVDSQNRLFKPQVLFNFKSSLDFPAYHRDFNALADDVRAWMSNGYRVVIFCGSPAAQEKMTGFFASLRPFNTGGKGKLDVVAEKLIEGAIFRDEKLVLIGTKSIAPGGGQKKVIRRGKRDPFTEPAIGAYVVHAYHGIGFCESVTRLKLGGAERDYAVIRYAGGDTLYVPVENMDSLSAFGEGEAEPKLSKIGGAEFARVKERVKASVAKMAVDLTELYAVRAAAKGHQYPKNRELDDEFAAAFPYNETEDQLTATDECLKDLERGKVMDRLLCGDVGYGKTEVALRAAYKVIADGKQVAFLSPTTILARQHFNTVKNRMEPFGVNAVSLTRFDAPKEIAAALESLQNGRADIVCGTHRMLSKDVAFRDLGLLILDEEQRFGVADKEKIKSLKSDVNVLTLSATPIPRTLHFSLSHIRDISVLDTPPEQRLPIKTYVTEYAESLLADAVLRETGRGGQTFIVYNRVASIDKFAAQVKNMLGAEVRVAVAHGQMAAESLENTVEAFTAGKYGVLVASSIIENGIDMPNANTMVVIDADHFGLAQLYQLRGRVGRSNRLAHVYFTFDGHKVLTESAYQRLAAITEFTEFGSGFKIAMRDLEIRGAGNILGREQHGHIERVGYEMYARILAEAVAELGGWSEELGVRSEERWMDDNECTTRETQRTMSDEKEGSSSTVPHSSLLIPHSSGFLPDVKVTTDFNAFIPDDYIADKALRVRVYTRISQTASMDERKRLMAELKDIYGPIPHPTENLILIALLKNLAARLRAEGVTVKRAEAFVKFRKTADIPPSAARFKGAKIDPIASRVLFGADRAGMLKFLLG